MLFPENLGTHLNIDKTTLSHGELYTIITNKAAKGRKGAIAAIVSGTESEDVNAVLERIPEEDLNKVEEVTPDVSESLRKTVLYSFPETQRVTDHFHVQRLAFDAIREMRIAHRRNAIGQETGAKEEAKLFKK